MPDPLIIDIGPDDDLDPAALGARIREAGRHHDEIHLWTEGLAEGFVHVRRFRVQRSGNGTSFALHGASDGHHCTYADPEAMLRAEPWLLGGREAEAA